jgi:hypothetical protein
MASTVRQTAVPAWQTPVTIALIVHLFLVAVAVISNVGGQASPVGRALRRIPGAVPYLQRTGLDLAYEFALASGAPADAPHTLELAALGAGGETLATLPDVSSMIGLRAQRYRQLAGYAADFDAAFAENPDLRSELAMAIAARWLQDLGWTRTSYELRCLPMTAQRLDPRAAEQNAQQRSDDDEPMTLQLIWSDWEERYQAVRKQAAGLTAQPRKAAASPSANAAEGSDAR